MTSNQITYRLRRGAWVKFFPNVYLIRPAQLGYEAKLLGAVMWAGSGALAGLRSAAFLHGLVDSPKAIDVVTTLAGRPPPEIVLHRCIVRDVADRKTVRGIPATSIPRTLADLGSVVSEDVVEKALERARRMGLTTIPYLYRCLERIGGRGRRGAGVLRRLLDERDPHGHPIGSDLAVEFWQVVRRARLPRPIPEHEVHDEVGFVARPDFAYPNLKLAIEIDGRETHDTAEAYYEDRRRETALKVLGWVVLRFTADDIRRRRAWMLEEIARAISAG